MRYWSYESVTKIKALRPFLCLVVTLYVLKAPTVEKAFPMFSWQIIYCSSLSRAHDQSWTIKSGFYYIKCQLYLFLSCNCRKMWRSWDLRMHPRCLTGLLLDMRKEFLIYQSTQCVFVNNVIDSPAIYINQPYYSIISSMHAEAMNKLAPNLANQTVNDANMSEENSRQFALAHKTWLCLYGFRIFP